MVRPTASRHATTQEDHLNAAVTVGTLWTAMVEHVMVSQL